MKITIFGSGSFGSTLANILTDNGHDVLLYDRNIDKVSIINNLHVNPNFNDYHIDEHIKATTDIIEACKHANTYVLAVISAAIRPVLEQIKDKVADNALFVNVAKGIDYNTLETISQIAASTLIKPYRFVTLSGPSLAKDIMDKKITLFSAASTNLDDAKIVQELFSNTKYIRVYTNDDIIGVEVNGSVKNAIALISGILSGLYLGENARAALICRGLEELKKIMEVYGGKETTLYGLSGLGDLIVTSMSYKSRNFQAGLKIAEGKKLDEILGNAKEVIEGISTIKACHQISLKYNLDIPIINTAYEVVFEEKDPLSQILKLMKRDLTNE